MRTAFIATAFLVLLALAHAETFEKAKLRVLSRKMSTETLFSTMKESQFGKTLASMLALKFQTSEGELNALNQALEELEDLLNQQQEADDQQFSDKSSALSNLIGSNQETIAETTGSLADLNNQLSQNQLDLGDANVNLSNLEQDAQAITELLAQLAELRANEQARHDSAVRVQSALVAGLQRVVELFQGAQSNSEIDQGAVTNILGLLDQLIAAFQASVADENALELQSESDYVSTVTPKQSQLDEDNDAISQLNVLIPAIEATVAQLQSSIASAEQTLANAEQLLAEYQTELQTATNTHSNNSVTRAEQLRLLALVQSRLNENPDDVQEVLNNA